MVITEILKILETEQFQYTSDQIRYELLKSAISNKIKNTNDPDYFKLIDDFNGYDDQVYIQFKDNKIIYYEGWVKACWDAIKLKSEYNNLSKPEIIKSIITNRFKKIAKILNLKITNYEYFKYRSKYIMKIEMEI